VAVAVILIGRKKMKLHENGTIEAFAMIVDINCFTQMVSKSSPSDGVAQFVRDVLSSGIDTIQKHGGSVVSFMGDAFLAILDNPDSVYMSCVTESETYVALIL
jgi:class 3 adenylate cyclase